MKIKKNGKTINLTESDIKILSKRLLKEQKPDPIMPNQRDINAQDKKIHKELEERVSTLEKKVSQLESKK